MKSTMMESTHGNPIDVLYSGRYHCISKLWCLYQHIYTYDHKLIIKNAKKFFAIKHILDAYFIKYEYKNDRSFRAGFLDEHQAIKSSDTYSYEDGNNHRRSNIYTWFQYRFIEISNEAEINNDDLIETINASNLNDAAKTALLDIINDVIDINTKSLEEITQYARDLTYAFFYENEREFIEMHLTDRLLDYDATYIACAFLILIRNHFPTQLKIKIHETDNTPFVSTDITFFDTILIYDTLRMTLDWTSEDVLMELHKNDKRLLTTLHYPDSSLLCKSLPQ